VKAWGSAPGNLQKKTIALKERNQGSGMSRLQRSNKIIGDSSWGGAPGYCISRFQRFRTIALINVFLAAFLFHGHS
jgi:hypothetical protein